MDCERPLKGLRQGCSAENSAFQTSAIRVGGYEGDRRKPWLYVRLQAGLHSITADEGSSIAMQKSPIHWSSSSGTPKPHRQRHSDARGPAIGLHSWPLVRHQPLNPGTLHGQSVYLTRGSPGRTNSFVSSRELETRESAPQPPGDGVSEFQTWLAPRRAVLRASAEVLTVCLPPDKCSSFGG